MACDWPPVLLSDSPDLEKASPRPLVSWWVWSEVCDVAAKAAADCSIASCPQNTVSVCRAGYRPEAEHRPESEVGYGPEYEVGHRAEADVGYGPESVAGHRAGAGYIQSDAARDRTVGGCGLEVGVADGGPVLSCSWLGWPWHLQTVGDNVATGNTNTYPVAAASTCGHSWGQCSG